MSFPLPFNSGSGIFVCDENILELYNAGLPKDCEALATHIDPKILNWIGPAAKRHGWVSVTRHHLGFWFSMREQNDSSPASTLDEALSRAFTRIAQHACRMGESRARVWPPLSELP